MNLKALPTFAVILAACATAPQAINDPDGSAAPAGKPTDTAEYRAEAREGLTALVRRLFDPTAELVSADLFGEGHVHEAWRLEVRVGDKTEHYALKVFGDAETAARNAANFQRAKELGWKVPEQVYRGELSPYRSAPGVVMRYVASRSLAGAVRDLLSNGKGTAAVAALYGSVGEQLGGMHLRGRRARKADDLSGATLARSAAEACDRSGFCGPHSVRRMYQVAPMLDGDQVTFVHGDLYESQIITHGGSVASFLDFDECVAADPAMDVGYMLAHILLINPVTRQSVWGAPTPTSDEVVATTMAFLNAYRSTAQLRDEAAWGDFLRRSKGYMWVRIGVLVAKLEDNVHGKKLLDLIRRNKVEPFALDPFELHGIDPNG